MKDIRSRNKTQESARILELSQRDRSFLFNVINEGADATTQPNRHFVTVLDVEGRVLDETDTFGCTSENDRTGFKGCALRKESDGLADIENLFTAIGVNKDR